MQLPTVSKKMILYVSFLTPLLPQLGMNAQIVPTLNDTNTTTQQHQNAIDISGGKTSTDGSNLFHSFSQFNVNTGQVANFLSTPNIQNILGRVNGGNASVVNGTLQITGSNANLFLMNPAGIVFGANASLNLPASFTAITATGINFRNGQFNTIGNNDYANLFGNPTAFTFGLNQPGSIVNGANLSVNPGQNINLIGGTVVSTGTVNATQGSVNIAAVPGTSLVRISQPGNLLSLEIPGAATVNFTPATLPQLLTGSGVSGITVAGNNVSLDRTNIPINPGDVVVNQLTAGTSTVAAANNLHLIGSNLKTTSDLTLRAQNTVAIKDTNQDPLNITAGQKLLIQGDKKVDIFALNNPNTNLSAGGDLLLRSSTTVGGDGHFNTGGNFKIEQLDGKLGGLFSPYDPIIRANGDVEFANYTGASLHIIAGGKVKTGNITITGTDTTSDNTTYALNGLIETNVATLADGTIVNINGTTIPTLDIRAGVLVTAIGTTGKFGAPFSSSSAVQPIIIPIITASPTDASILLGDVNFSSTSGKPFVFLTNQYKPNTSLAAGDIKVGTIDTKASSVSPTFSSLESGNITIVGKNNVTVNGLTTSVGNSTLNMFGNTGNIAIEATGNILATGLITTENPNTNSSSSGNVSINSTNGSVTLDRVTTQAAQPIGKAGDITVNAADKISTKDLDTRTKTISTGASGNVSLTSNNSSIDTTNVLTDGGFITLVGKNNINVIQLNSSLGKDRFIHDTGNIVVTTSGDINATGLISTANDTTGSAGNVSLTSTNGKVTTDLVSTQLGANNFSSNRKAGNIDITAANAIVSKDLDTRHISNQNTFIQTGGNINLTSNNSSIDTGNLATGGISLGNSGNVKATAKTNLTTGNIITTANNGNGGNIDLTSTAGKVTIQQVASQINNGSTANLKAGTINITAADTISTKALDTRSQTTQLIPSASGNINLTSNNGSIDTTTISTNNGNIILKSSSDILATGLISSEYASGATGDISLTSTNGKITTDRISTQLASTNAATAKAGDINLKAAGAISTSAKNLETGSLSNYANHTGGNIQIESTNSSIDTSNLTTGIGSTGNSGSVKATAKTNLTTGNIITTANNGNGGKVTLNSGNDIEVGYINTSTNSANNGGAVDITAPHFFKAANSTVISAAGNNSPISASIYTNGNPNSGAITIQHGGNGLTPFVVGDATTNGTKAAIISSNNNAINPSQSLPASYSQGNTKLITGTQPTTVVVVEKEKEKEKPPSACPPDCPPTKEVPKVVTTETTKVTTIKEKDPVDLKFTSDFADLKSFNTENPQAILKKIQHSTGVQPAIIYATFAPASLDLDIIKDKNNISELARNSFQLELVMVTQDGPPTRKTIPVTREKLIQTVKQFRKQITNPSDATAFLPNAQQLYQWLIAPLENDLKTHNVQNLVFIMDAGLRGLPMAALHDGKQFLVERYSVGMMPSVALTDTRYVDIRNAKVLAMGAENTPDQAPLPAVPIELKTISSTIWTGKSLENDRFTASNLVAQRQEQPFGILHLATHGEFKPGALKNSYIQFKDERLGLDRLRQLKLNDPPVELMVLSACRTALGDEEAELGFAGVANRAGVKSAMGSLWYVSDEGTLGLMTSFYRNLKTAPIKAEALRQAQVAMLHGKVRLQQGKLISGNDNIDLPPSLLKLGDISLTHPFYWSAFTIVGNPW